MANQKQTLSEQTEHEIGVLFSEAAASIRYLLENAADEALSIDAETEVPAAIETLEEKITDLVSKLFSAGSVGRMISELEWDEQKKLAVSPSTDEMISELTDDGYTVLKTESLADRNALEDFVRSTIYPYNVNYRAGEGAFA